MPARFRAGMLLSGTDLSSFRTGQAAVCGSPAACLYPVSLFSV